jgi:hypothetical protein
MCVHARTCVCFHVCVCARGANMGVGKGGYKLRKQSIRIAFVLCTVWKVSVYRSFLFVHKQIQAV